MGRVQDSEMKPALADYFSRMVAVPDIGSEGLRKLQSARVTVVGVGGVGSSTASYLAQAGIGHLRVIDQDIIEPSNLHRLHGMDGSHLYHPKAEVIAESLSKSYPWTDAEPIVETLRQTNVDELLERSDIVVDGLDNFRTRYLLNEYSVERSTPYVFTSAIQNQGHIGLFHPPRTGCLECSFQNVVDRPEESCETLGVTPTVTGLVGAFAANETAKAVLALPSRQLGKIMTIDALIPDIFFSEVSKRGQCQTCGETGTRQRTPGINTPMVLCGGKTISVLPEFVHNIDLDRASRSIVQEAILTSSGTVLVYRNGGVIVSLFKTGRVLVQGIEDEEAALRTAREAWNLAAGPTMPVAY